MHDFRRLRVWQRARDLVFVIDSATRGFPRDDGGIVARQLRRAALSIPANIAEGCGKPTRPETIRFLGIAAGSAREVENHLEIAAGLGYLRPQAHRHLGEEIRLIQGMLHGLMKNLPE